ncbi:MAG: HAMP domain-containing protein [Chloroflexi bacterium]|nr:HAMP domain-containing protein [Chloroflexota bacterium]
MAESRTPARNRSIVTPEAASFVGSERGRIRTKIVAWFLIPSAVISIAVGLLAFYAYRRVTEDLVLTRNRDRALLLANQLSAELTRYTTGLATLDSAGRVQPESLVETWHNNTLLFDGGLLMLNATGQIVATAPHRPELVGQYALDPLLTGDERRYSNIISDLIPDTEVIALSWPLYDSEAPSRGTLIGLLRAQRDVARGSTFYQRIWGLYIGRGEMAFICDGNGRVIFHPDTFLIGEDLSNLEGVQYALRGESGAIRTLDLEGRTVVAGFAPVPGTAWGLVTEEGWAAVTRASRPYTRFLLILLALGVIVPAIVAAFGTRRITGPLTRLTEATERIAAGDFGQTIDIQTGDELESLAQRFNIMSMELAASYSTLEQRVKERTGELAALNDISAVVSRSLELDDVLEAALSKTLDVLNIEAGAAFRVEKQSALLLMAHKGLSAQFVQEVHQLSLSDSLAGETMATEAPALRLVADYPTGRLRSLLEKEGLQMIISVPLTAKGTVLGVLNLATHTPRTITPEERSLLSAIGQQTGMAVDNARLYEQARTSAAEEERIRLARELHDAVSQTLFAARLISDVLPRLWARDPEEGERRLEDLKRLTRGAMAEMRTLLIELRPSALLNSELPDLLHQLAEAMMGKAQAEVSLDIGAIPPLPAEIKVAFYRIAQEAMNNIVKHAQANHVKLHLGQEETAIRLHISDDGCGFEPGESPAGHFGLINIRERARGIGAHVAIESASGQGTRVTVVWRQNE